MTSITRSALVMHSAEQMYALVNDVESYPQFLAGCSATELISKNDEELVASLTISKIGVNQTFTTRNKLQYPDRMELTLVDGPFSRFIGVWHFQRLSDEACKVSFDMDFEVNNKLAGIALGVVFKQMATTMVDSFVQRAKQVYD
ncbi:MAG: type II toxin-antitoxin system RatA family toxin [Oleispira sp.]|nr:type II toxin-antitoxin system RatA family toxin [Oleispira sp.]MBL4880387.1 type II toxin-antitoxin system RatA family toxin [Oleispira sp.]